jgi:4-aminobutyrate aminotransferase
LPEGAIHAPPFYRRPAQRDGEPVDSPRWAEASLAAMRAIFAKERDIAAVIAEPIRSTPHVPPDFYWPEVRRLCDANGALLVFDEIATGLGKTGKLFASEHVGARPDITVLGKCLGGGIVPIAAVIARADLDCAPELALGHYTHEKNPFTTCAALTTLATILEGDLPGRALTLGARAQARVGEMAKRQPSVRGMRGHGLLFAIEMKPGLSVESIAWRALDKGVNLSASEGRDLSVTAPLVIGEEELDRALDVVEAAIAEEAAAADQPHSERSPG